MTLFVGVDPGLSIGLAVFHDTHRVLVLQADETQSIEALRAVLDARDPANPMVHVGCERYLDVGRGHRTAQTDAQRFIGRLTQLLDEYSFIRLHMQLAADAHRLMPNKMMQRLGVWVRASDVGRSDANDANTAVRHALLAMLGAAPATFKKLISTVEIG